MADKDKPGNGNGRVKDFIARWAVPLAVAAMGLYATVQGLKKDVPVNTKNIAAHETRIAVNENYIDGHKVDYRELRTEQRTQTQILGRIEAAVGRSRRRRSSEDR